MTQASEAELVLIPSPATGEPGSLTPPRSFNLMFQTSVGALADASSTAFLRPETAQGIFTNFKVRLSVRPCLLAYLLACRAAAAPADAAAAGVLPIFDLST